MKDKWLRVTHRKVVGTLNVVQDKGEVFVTVIDEDEVDTTEPTFQVDKSPLTKVTITKVCRQARVYIEHRETGERLIIDNDLNIIENNGFDLEWVPFGR